MTALHARWSAEHQHQPVAVRTVRDIDDLITTLLAASGEQPLAAELTLDRSIPPGLPPDRPSPWLLVGVNAREQLGSVRLTLHGHWYAHGHAAHDGAICCYHLLGARRAFPAAAVITLDEVALAIQDFLLTSGRRRTPCLAWTVWPADLDLGEQ